MSGPTSCCSDCCALTRPIHQAPSANVSSGSQASALRAVATGMQPAGDLVLAFVSDEEAGGDLGAAHLVRERPDLLAGVRYALGEFGGFTLDIGGRRFYPIQVAEKQLCWLKATVRGPGGHGALPMRGGAMARLGALLRTLDRRRLPVHVTQVARRMIEQTAAELPQPAGVLLRQLLDPRLTDHVLRLLGERGRVFDPLLGPDVELEVLRHEPGPPAADLGLFALLAGVLREADPAGTPIPLLLAAFTDARHFARLGIQATASRLCSFRARCASRSSFTRPMSASRWTRCGSAPTPCSKCSSATGARAAECGCTWACPP